MRNNEEYSRLATSGLRTKYFPKNRLGHGFLIISPWIDILLLFIFMILLNKSIIVQPGIVIDLEQSSFGDATHGGLEIVIMSVKGVNGNSTEDIVFFDDVRFKIKNIESQNQLMKIFKESINELEDSNLVIYADRAVAHGTIITIMNLAKEAGIAKVNMATSPL